MTKKLLTIFIGLIGMLSCSKGFYNAYEKLSEPVSNQPAVSTEQPGNITAISALSGGYIAGGNIADVTARGVCWSLKSGPTLNDICTQNGKGVGYYASSITGLVPDTTYYVRAYVSYKAGTNYGEELSFKTNTSVNDITEFKFLKNNNSPNINDDFIGVIEQGSTEDDYTISVGVSPSTNLTQLKASFSHTGASVKVLGADQTSGISFNDFSSPVTYVVTSLDGLKARNFKVTVYYYYQVSYDTKGASVGLPPTDKIKYKTGDTVTVMGNIGNMVNTGYIFDGWNTQSDYLGINYAVGQTFSISASNITLYAKWKPIPTYSITYISNGHDGGTVPVDIKFYLPGMPVSIMDQGTLSKTNYYFESWYDNPDFTGNPYAPGGVITMGNNNIILYAKWSQYENHQIKYYSDSLDLLASDPFVQGSLATLRANDFGLTHANGYSFYGWGTGTNCSGTVYIQSSSFMMGNHDILLYPCWKQ